MSNMCTEPIVTWLIAVTCGTHMYIHLSYKSIKYLAYMVYMPNLMGVYVSSTYLAITCEICIVVGYVLAQICKNVGSVYPFNMLVV